MGLDYFRVKFTLCVPIGIGLPWSGAAVDWSSTALDRRSRSVPNTRRLKPGRHLHARPIDNLEGWMRPVCTFRVLETKVAQRQRKSHKNLGGILGPEAPEPMLAHFLPGRDLKHARRLHPVSGRRCRHAPGRQDTKFFHPPSVGLRGAGRLRVPERRRFRSVSGA